jgi:hypothetical protein
MKSIIGGFVLLLIGFGAGVASVIFKLGLNPVELISSPVPLSKVSKNLSKPKSNDNKYEIVYEGQTGKAFTGGYVIASFLSDSPMRAEKVEALFPHKVDFFAPADAVVNSSIFEGEGKTKIFKNGVECKSPPPIVGSGIPQTPTAYCNP